MSRVETDTFINDRYAAMEDRLTVCVLNAIVNTCLQCNMMPLCLTIACTCRLCARGLIAHSHMQRRWVPAVASFSRTMQRLCLDSS